MKTRIVLIVMLGLVGMSGTAQTWQWSKQSGGTDWESVSKMCIDPNANVYIAGDFKSSDFFSGTDTLFCNNYDDFFIAKYASNGNLLWIKGFGGNNTSTSFQGINALSFDQFSNTIIAAGNFSGNSTFDTITLVSNGSTDAFVAKFDLNGNCIWAKKAGGTSIDAASAMAVNNLGEIFVNCEVSTTSTFDTITVSAGGILAKYDVNGNCLWAKKKFNTNNTMIGYDAFFRSIKCSGNDIFGIGVCAADSFIIDTISFHANNYSNMQNIIARFDSNGIAKWIKPCAGSGAGGADIVVDDSSNSFITGAFVTSGIFDNDTIYTNYSDLFFAKYNSLGHLIWVKQAYSTNSAAGNGLFLKNGSVYLTGYFSDTASFGNFTINTTNSRNLFVSRYDTGGNCIGVRYVANSAGNAVCADTNGAIYVTGTFLGIATFDSNPSLISLGNQDIFVAKSSEITGMGEIKPQQFILLFPNPFSTQATLTFQGIKNEHNKTLSVYNLLGQEVQNIFVGKDKEVIIHRNNLPSGMYFYKLMDDSKSVIGMGKMVVE